MAIKVFLIDDHSVVRDGLRAIINRKSPDIKVVGEAADGEEALRLAKKHPADIYLVDISLPIMNGLELIPHLKKMYPQSKFIVLSMHDKHYLVENAVKLGASGYIVKESATGEIVKAINEVHKGKFFFSDKISPALPAGFPKKLAGAVQKEFNKLTKREREILQLIAEGFTDREMAKKLGRSFNTVHVHRNKIMKKLNLHRQADLIRYALKEDISFI